MSRRDKNLDNYEYDNYLAENKKTRELQERRDARKSKGYEGWHFGIGEKPVFTRSKEEFRQELSKRGLVMRDDVKRSLK